MERIKHPPDLFSEQDITKEKESNAATAQNLTTKEEFFSVMENIHTEQRTDGKIGRYASKRAFAGISLSFGEKHRSLIRKVNSTLKNAGVELSLEIEYGNKALHLCIQTL